MTPEQELELLQLQNANEDEDRARAAAAPKDPGLASTSLIGGLQGLTGGNFDEMGGGIGKATMRKGVTLGAAFRPSPDDTPEVRALKLAALADERAQPTNYQLVRDGIRSVDDAAAKFHPGLHTASQIAGGLLLAPYLPGGGATTTLGKVAVGGGMGLGLGALNGLGNSRAELAGNGDAQVGRAAWDTGTAALEGGAFGMALPLASAVRGGLVNGVITPTAEAKGLRALGVPLTTAMMDPHSFLAGLEETGANAHGGGQGIKALRRNAMEGWQNAVINEARAPNSPPIEGGGDISSRLQQVDEGYRNAYDQLAGHRVDPDQYLGDGKWRPLLTDESVVGAAKRRGAFELAAGNRSIPATDATRQMVSDFLQEQMALLPRKPGINGVPAEALQDMRSNIRAAARERLTGNAGAEDRAAARMFGDAADHITGLFKEQLPPDVYDAVAGADSKYGTLKQLEKTVRASGDQEAGFTPAQLSQSIKTNTPVASYARGGGGPLRELARMGKASVEAKIPLTGVQGLMGWGPLPEWAIAPAARLSNVPSVQRALLGETGWQRYLKKAGEGIGSSSTASALDRMLPNPGATVGSAVTAEGAFSPLALLANILRKREEDQGLASQP